MRSTSLLVTLMALSLAGCVAGCAHGGGKASTPAAPPPRLSPVPHFTLHWNDAGDTTRTLRWPSNKAFRTDLTLTGLVDSLQGYTIQFRMEPTSTTKGSAWKFANDAGCLAAVWQATAEKDPKAPAPWPNKLLITDVRPLVDGSVAFVVAATFDMVKLNPDSTYSLCHMDFTPPQAASDSVTCAGWDAPVRLYVEQATLLFKELEQPVFEMGKPIYFEPVPSK
ncbi:MAG TPA: hypothetical protein VGR66_00560 [Candidatus Eisenbacteria bacterium]|jgi:hypothetical protein|nr:hypothetical protein [Candidatus Eisenbacteria bacterium]